MMAKKDQEYQYPKAYAVKSDDGEKPSTETRIKLFYYKEAPLRK